MKRAEDFLARQLKKREHISVDENESQVNSNVSNNNTTSQEPHLTFQSRFENKNNQSNYQKSGASRSFMTEIDTIVQPKKKSLSLVILAIIMVIGGGVFLLMFFSEPVAYQPSVPVVTQNEDTNQMIDVRESVVGVEVDTAATATQGLRDYGTAFAVTSRDLITNKHVTEDSIQNTVKLYHPNWTYAKIAVIKEVSKSNDLTWLQLQEGETDLPGLTVFCGDTYQGERVYTLGYPAYALHHSNGVPEVTMDVGVIKAVSRVVNNNNCFEMSATINGGNSGGPLFNSSNQVIGVNTFGLDDYENCFFAIKIDTIKLTFPALWEKMSVNNQR